MSTPVQSAGIGRIAAAVWGAIALAGAVTTIGPLEIPGSDTGQMRTIAAIAGVCAGISFVLPWSRLPRFAFSLGLVAMSAVIAALANASGAAQSELTILFTFVVALAASFMPVRASVAQLAVIAVLLMGLMLVVGRSDSTEVDVLRVTLLLASLIVLCGLVLVMRATLDERALGMRGRGSHRYRSVLLDPPHFEAALDTELSRAGRHERPLSVVVLDVMGSVAETQGRRRRSALAATGRAVVSRIRSEDSVGRLEAFRFALVAPETTSAGAAVLAATLTGVVRERLLVAGHDPREFAVLAGWAEFPHRATTREELMAAAVQALEDSAVGAEQPAGQGNTQARPAAGPA
jgi:GGDEF domain-containing protein